MQATMLLHQAVCLKQCGSSADCPQGYRCVLLRWDAQDNANVLVATKFCMSPTDPPPCTGTPDAICDFPQHSCQAEGGVAGELYAPKGAATCGIEYVTCAKGCSPSIGCQP